MRVMHSHPTCISLTFFKQAGSAYYTKSYLAYHFVSDENVAHLKDVSDI